MLSYFKSFLSFEFKQKRFSRFLLNVLRRANSYFIRKKIAEEKLGPVDTLSEFLKKSKNKSCYLRPLTRSEDGFRYVKLQGYRIPVERAEEAYLSRYSCWPKLENLKNDLKNVRYFSKKDKVWKEYDESSLTSARDALSAIVKLQLIQEDKSMESFDPLDIGVEPRIMALLIGMFAADGYYVSENRLARISMTRPFFSNLFESIVEVAGTIFIVNQRKSSKPSSKRMIEIALSDKRGAEYNEDFIKLSAWLSLCFGHTGQKSRGFDIYPNQISSWPEKVKQSYLLGYFIGDGSVSLSKCVRGRSKPQVRVNLFCKPRALPEVYYAGAQLLLSQCVNKPCSISGVGAKSLYVEANFESLSMLTETWNELQSTYNLRSCYKLDCLEVAKFIKEHKFQNSIEAAISPLIEINMSKKPNNISEITAKVLMELKGLSDISPVNPIRNRIATQYFDEQAPEHYTHVHGAEQARRFFTEIESFQRKHVKDDNLISPKKIGDFIRAHKEYGPLLCMQRSKSARQEIY